MSKKKKRKFHHSPNFSASISAPGLAQGSEVTGTSPAASLSVTPAAPPAKAAAPSNTSMGDAHAAEYRIIKHDLIKVAVLNALFLAGVLVLYYTNLESQYLERWFASILN